jgi:hypothetical protein
LKGRSAKQKTKRRLTFNLLLLHLKDEALGLDRLLQADDGGALLLEGLLLIRVRDAEGNQLVVEPRDVSIPFLQRFLRRLASGALPLECRPSVSKSGPLLLELTLGLLACGALLPELVLHRGKHSNLGIEGGLQLVSLLGLLLGGPRPLLSLALLGLRLMEPRAELLIVALDGAHLCLPVGRQGARPLQIPPHLLQRFIPIDEGCANPLEGGGMRCGLAFMLQELIAQDLRLVRQPAVGGPQGLREHDEGVTLLLEPAKLGTHLVEGAVLVAGAVLELLPPTNQNQ